MNDPVVISRALLLVWCAATVGRRLFVAVPAAPVRRPAKARGQALGNPCLAEARATVNATRTAGADTFAASVAPVIAEAQAAGVAPTDRHRSQRARHRHGAGRQMGSGDRAEYPQAGRVAGAGASRAGNCRPLVHEATRCRGDSGEHAGPITTLGTHGTSVSRRRCISPGHWRQSAGRHSDRAE